MGYAQCALEGCEVTFRREKGKRMKYCCHEHAKEGRKQSWAKAAKKSDSKKKYCEICKCKFTPRNKLQVLCGKTSCKKKRAKLKAKELSDSEYPMERRCSICNEKFISKGPKNHICSNEDCKYKNGLRLRRESGRRNKNKEKKKPGQHNEPVMWDWKKFGDPYKEITAPLSGLPGRHAQFHPMS